MKTDACHRTVPGMLATILYALAVAGCVSTPNDYATGLEAVIPTTLGLETYKISLMPRAVLEEAARSQEREVAGGLDAHALSSQGSVYRAYRRWLEGDIRPLSESASSVSQ